MNLYRKWLSKLICWRRSPVFVHYSTGFTVCCATGKSLESCGIYCYRYGRCKQGAVGTDLWELDWAVLRYPWVSTKAPLLFSS